MNTTSCIEKKYTSACSFVCFCILSPTSKPASNILTRTTAIVENGFKIRDDVVFLWRFSVLLRHISNILISHSHTFDKRHAIKLTRTMVTLKHIIFMNMFTKFEGYYTETRCLIIQQFLVVAIDGGRNVDVCRHLLGM